jgi:menaquinone-dependent protoporphyrinogen oxidase
MATPPRLNVLIIYGTTEGHTRHMCQFLEAVLTEDGYEVTCCDAAFEPIVLTDYDLCFIAGSLHVGNFQPALLEYVRNHHEALNTMPAAFLPVSLSAAGHNPDDWEGLDDCVARFLQSTGWKPTAVHHVAGAIRYSQYDFFKRLALKFIAKRRGQDTVTSRDYDLTDYDDLSIFVRQFVSGHSEGTA